MRMKEDTRPEVRPVVLEDFDKAGYTVDSDGNVFTPQNRKLVPKQNKSSRGFYVYLIDNNGKSARKNVALLVATAFLPNPDGCMMVGFKDGNPENYCADNLEWLYSAKKPKKIRIYIPTKNSQDVSFLNESLKPKPVAQYSLNGVLLKEWPSIRTAAQENEIPFNGIWQCCKGKRKSAGGFIWRSIEEGDTPLQKVEPKKRRPAKKKAASINYSAEPVSQHSLEDVFIRDWNNPKEAGKQFGSKYAYTNIIKAARGQRPNAYGYIWKFKRNICK